jgi:uncharacterized membrane-anchored protein
MIHRKQLFPGTQRSTRVQKPLLKILTQASRSAARIGAKALPSQLRKRLEDRFFYAIFNLTRVTNDHYPTLDPKSPKED